MVIFLFGKGSVALIQYIVGVSSVSASLLGGAATGVMLGRMVAHDISHQLGVVTFLRICRCRVQGARDISGCKCGRITGRGPGPAAAAREAGKHGVHDLIHHLYLGGPSLAIRLHPANVSCTEDMSSHC